MSDLVGNPEDRFSHVAAQIVIEMNISGAIVHHTYQTSGKKTVHVTAKNQVEKLERREISLCLSTMKYKVRTLQ